jgi:acyl carrier protein
MVLEKVKAIIAEEFDVEEDTINTDTTLEELGADSLDVVELVMALEEEFDIDIPEDSAENLFTVGDVVSFIKKNMS